MVIPVIIIEAKVIMHDIVIALAFPSILIKRKNTAYDQKYTVIKSENHFIL